MTADRWYYLRHPLGFSDEFFSCVVAGAKSWRELVEACVSDWAQSGPKGPPPAYAWYEPTLSAGRRVVTIPVGGKGTYGSYHLFEEVPPSQFWNGLPAWFVRDLEVGRRDTAGWFPETVWAKCGWNEPAGPGETQGDDVAASVLWRYGLAQLGRGIVGIATRLIRWERWAGRGRRTSG